MILLFVMGLILVMSALTLAGMALAGERPTGGITRSLAVLEAMGSAPSEMTKDLDRPFGERILEPLQARALKVGRRLSGSDAADRIRHKLDLAGNPRGWTVDRVLSGKVIGAIALALVGLAFALIVGAPGTMRILALLVGLGVGFFVPDFYLYQRSYDRSQQMQRDLPDAIDLMTISVESGLGFDAAVQQVARNTEGPLAEEFSRLLREMQIGQGRVGGAAGDGRPQRRRRPAVVRQRHGPGRHPRHPGGHGAARAVQGNARQAPPAGRDQGPAGAGQDHRPAHLLYPSLSVHGRYGTGCAYCSGWLRLGLDA